METGGYSIYPGRPNTRSTGPQLSIAKDGRFSLNKNATALFEEQAIEKVLLKWNPSSRRIALQSIKKKDPRAFTVRYGKGSQTRGAGFNAKGFLEAFVGYDLAKPSAFDAEWNSEECQLEFCIPAALLKKVKASALTISSARTA